MRRIDYACPHIFFPPGLYKSVQQCTEMEEHNTPTSNILIHPQTQLNVYFTNLHAFVVER